MERGSLLLMMIMPKQSNSTAIQQLPLSQNPKKCRYCRTSRVEKVGIQEAKDI
jgi:hypothetical protein